MGLGYQMERYVCIASNHVILETERLFLREMNMDDFDALYVILADSDIMQHYPYSFDEKRVRESGLKPLTAY